MSRLYELAPEYARLVDAADDGDDVAVDLERIGGELSAKVGAQRGTLPAASLRLGAHGE